MRRDKSAKYEVMEVWVSVAVVGAEREFHIYAPWLLSWFSLMRWQTRPLAQPTRGTRIPGTENRASTPRRCSTRAHGRTSGWLLSSTSWRLVRCSRGHSINGPGAIYHTHRESIREMVPSSGIPSTVAFRVGGNRRVWTVTRKKKKGKRKKKSAERRWDRLQLAQTRGSDWLTAAPS